MIGLRLGGRIRRSIPAAVAAAAKRQGRSSTLPATTTTAAFAVTAGAPPPQLQLMDVVHADVNFIQLKLLLSSSSCSTTATDIPDLGRILLLDYTLANTGAAAIPPNAKKHSRERGSLKSSTTRLVDITLVNRIHAAVLYDLQQMAMTEQPPSRPRKGSRRPRPAASAVIGAEGGEDGGAAGKFSPLLVLVETDLSAEDAEVQQFILRNALHMNPLPLEVAMDSGAMVPTPRLTVIVLSEEETKRVRANAALPDARRISMPAQSTPQAADVAPEGSPKLDTPPPASTPVAPKEAKETQGTKALTHAATTESTSTTATTAATNMAPSTTTTSTAVEPPAKRPSVPIAKAVEKLAKGTVAESVPVAVHAATSAPLYTLKTKVETVLWKSCSGCPVDISFLRPLLRPMDYAELSKAATNSHESGRDAIHEEVPPTMQLVVYRIGEASSVQSVWEGATAAVASLVDELTNGASTLTEDLLEYLHPEQEEQPTKTAKERRGAAPAKRQKKQQPDPPRTMASVFLLVHTNLLTTGDADFYRVQLGDYYSRLPEPIRQQFCGVAVITAAEVSSARLCYLLEKSSNAAAAAAVPVPDGGSAADAEMDDLFRDVYRRISSNSLLCDGKSDGAVASNPVPSADRLIDYSLRIAALIQAILRQREAEMRAQVAAAQPKATEADSEEIARAAQCIEIKSMVTEAVEKVSVRHEQATAHLVKTLSSMAGQWSIERLADTMEILVKDQMKSIQETLEERLPPEGQVFSAADASAQATAGVQPHDDGVSIATDNAAAIASMSTAQAASHAKLEEILASVHSLTRLVQTQVDTLQASINTAEVEQRRLGAAQSSAAVILENGQESLKISSKATMEAVERLKEELQSVQEQVAHFSSTLATTAVAGVVGAPPPTVTAVSDATASSDEAKASESASIIRKAVEEATETIGATMQKRLASQIEVFCRSQRDTHGEVEMPLLPVTSFELEEMVSRIVSDAVKWASQDILDHVWAVQDPSKRALSGLAGLSGSSIKSDELIAILKDCWRQAQPEPSETKTETLQLVMESYLEKMQRTLEANLAKKEEPATVNMIPSKCTETPK